MPSKTNHPGKDGVDGLDIAAPLPSEPASPSISAKEVLTQVVQGILGRALRGSDLVYVVEEVGKPREKVDKPELKCNVDSGVSGIGGDKSMKLCSSHQKMRTSQNLMDDGLGGYRCMPGEECKHANPDRITHITSNGTSKTNAPGKTYQASVTLMPISGSPRFVGEASVTKKEAERSAAKNALEKFPDEVALLGTKQSCRSKKRQFSEIEEVNGHQAAVSAKRQWKVGMGSSSYGDKDSGELCSSSGEAYSNCSWCNHMREWIVRFLILINLRRW